MGNLTPPRAIHGPGLLGSSIGINTQNIQETTSYNMFTIKQDGGIIMREIVSIIFSTLIVTGARSYYDRAMSGRYKGHRNGSF